jgi:hypothetical protein
MGSGFPARECEGRQSDRLEPDHLGKAPSASSCAAGRSCSLEEIVGGQEEMQSLAEKLDFLMGKTSRCIMAVVPGRPEGLGVVLTIPEFATFWRSTWLIRTCRVAPWAFYASR